MRYCPDCGFSLDLLHTRCPRCAETPATISDPGWTVVARFGSAAEAGFFANELSHRLQAEPRLIQRDQLDPLTHAWRPTFELTVAEAEATFAIVTLKDIVASTGGDVTSSRTREHFCTADRAPQESGINWLPIVLTLTAGSFVIWATGRPAAGPKQHGAADDLLKSLSSHPEPWTQRDPNGRDLRQLTVDPERRRVIIKQDLDGDGRFEIEDVVLESP